jgi:histone deacetylase 11
VLPAGSWPSDSNQQLPIVYHPHYNITLFGIEKLHPFDSCKFEKVVSGLQQQGIISGTKQLVPPAAVSYDTLQQVHAQEYLHKLQTSSLKVAQVG